MAIFLSVPPDHIGVIHSVGESQNLCWPGKQIQGQTEIYSKTVPMY